METSKRINIATDSANSAGIGFVIFQNSNDLEVGRVGYSGGRQEKSSQEILTSHRKFGWKFTHFVAFLKEVQAHVTRKISYQSKTFMFIER